MDSGCQGLWQGENVEWRVSLWGDKNLELDGGMVARLCEYTNNYWI